MNFLLVIGPWSIIIVLTEKMLSGHLSNGQIHALLYLKTKNTCINIITDKLKEVIEHHVL